MNFKTVHLPFLSENYLRVFICVFFTLALLLAPNTQAEDWHHGDTLFGELKYPKGFAHYDHVNPEAPKGGTFNQVARGGFDSFNAYIVRGNVAAGMPLLYDTLMEQAVDQPSASYGLIAEAFKFPDDYSSATYRLNSEAKWHDGQPITPEDVIWSLEKLKQIHPLYKQYFKNVASAEKAGEHEILFKFDIKGNRELPHIIGDLPVLPRHWWEGTTKDGTKRDISEPIAEAPLGSGPYRIAEFKLGEHIIWERVKNHWAENLGIRKGRYNFDRIRYTYYSDDNAMWEAFKKGGTYDLRFENVSRRWMTEYDFPAAKDGRIKRNAFPTTSSQPFQAYFFNTRKEKFKDKRVRKALSLLFDFETMNKNLFFGAYTRTNSYFEGGELQAPAGPPKGRVLEILNDYKGRIPPEALTKGFELPVYASSADTRRHQREALKLFRDAGYTFKNGKMLNPKGEPFTIEILGRGPTDERVGLPTREAFAKLGIETNIRMVDVSQYKERLDKFDFDMAMLVTLQSLSPGNEQREYWSTAAAKNPGARNYAGIADPVIDELVERIIKAENRTELIALTQALDSVLLHNYYAIPMWHNPDDWYAWWGKLKFPMPQPSYAGLDTYSGWIEGE